MTTLRRLVVLLAVEGAALLVLGIGFGVASLRDEGDHTAAEAAAGFAALGGLLLLLLAWFTDKGRSWTRAPVLTLNVFALPVGLSMVQGGAWYAGVPVLALAAAVFAAALRAD